MVHRDEAVCAQTARGVNLFAMRSDEWLSLFRRTEALAMTRTMLLSLTALAVLAAASVPASSGTTGGWPSKVSGPSKAAGKSQKKGGGLNLKAKPGDGKRDTVNGYRVFHAWPKK